MKKKTFLTNYFHIFLGDFSDAELILSGNNLADFPSSVFKGILEQMYNNHGKIYLNGSESCSIEKYQ